MTDEYIIREVPGDYPDIEQADAAVKRVRESDGDLVLKLDRIGTTPFLRFTPYRNHRGVRVHMWSCIALSAKVMPHRTVLFSYPRIVDPARLENYEVRMFTTEWVRSESRKSKRIEVIPADETPFAGDIMQWDLKDHE